MRGDVGQACARHRELSSYGNRLKALQGPLFGEGALGDSDLCLPGGGVVPQKLFWGCGHHLDKVASAF